MGLACGPLPFVLGDKRKQKRRRGSPGPQVILSVLFLGEPPQRYHKNQRYIRGHGPRLWAATCFQSRAQPNPGGPGPPCCMNVGSGDAVPADFLKKNSGLAPEGLSILAGTGAGHPPLWCPTMALKIKLPGGSRGAHLLPVFYTLMP